MLSEAALSKLFVQQTIECGLELIMELLKLSCKYFISLSLNIFRIFPIKSNRVLLINDLSYTYGDNLKYICEYLLNINTLELEIIFPLSKQDKTINKRIICVRPKTFKYFYYAVTSKVLITNSGGISYLPVRKQQMVINTWHGGGGYKKIGVSAFDNFYYKLENKLNAKKITYILASTELIKNEFSKALLIDKSKFLEIGMPRLDIFFSDYSKVCDKVRDFYSIEPNKKIVMYCPTYRSGTDALNDFYKPKQTIMNIEQIISAFKAKFGGEWILAERAHPKLKSHWITGNKQVLNFSNYPDMQELLCTADAVISDYSGLIWDYSFTKKPCFIYADDIVEYQNSRGFYSPIEEWPFPIATDFETLLFNIENYNQEIYETRVREHHICLGSYETGTATEYVCNMILNFCGNSCCNLKKLSNFIR